MKKINKYVYLHLLLFFFSFCGVFSKLAWRSPGAPSTDSGPGAPAGPFEIPHASLQPPGSRGIAHRSSDTFIG